MTQRNRFASFPSSLSLLVLSGALVSCKGGGEHAKPGATGGAASAGAPNGGSSAGGGAPAVAGGGAGGSSGASGGAGGSAGAEGAEAGRGARCDSLPTEPVPATLIAGISPTEDITFDAAGYIYWNRDTVSGGRLWRRRREGAPEAYCPAYASSFYAGMRMTSDRVLYVANNGASTLDRIEPDCTFTSVMTGVDLNGVELDPQGRAYVTEFGGTRVFRYDPDPDGDPTTDDAAVTTLNTLIHTPNGITFSPDFRVLYVDSWNGEPTATVFRIPLRADGTAAPMQYWANGVGVGQNDGMAADECGNVYVGADGGPGEVLRISRANPSSRTAVVSLPGETLHNFAWGQGGGWSEDRLYVVSLETGLYEANVGVRGKSYEQ